ncbi:hypothetical protein [Pseudanabaena sp. PCC 6802]|uniref:hypothetical protein n=1 Tax=Pseudanabaena sp. PCC 6802 TaxID=118173 RepID=UPI0003450442|nr:hypothetical protein [Pseudanabaena sp. PCC 6802]
MNQEIKLAGTIRYIDLGMGIWALVASSGEQYELLQPAPQDLLREGMTVTITGEIRDDVMTIAAIGPVLAVQQFQAI